MTHILALIVGFGSLAIYLMAFFFPEVHRKNDFIWSGVGLFYALVLWVFTPRIGGWFFLGQLAAVALLIWFGWQTFSLRRQVTPAMEQTPVPTAEAVKSNISLPERFSGLVRTVSGILPGKKQQVSQTQPAAATSTTEDNAATIAKSLVDAIEQEDLESVSDASVVIVDNTDNSTKAETVMEAIPPEPPPQELVEAAAEKLNQQQQNTPDITDVAPDAEFAPDAEVPPDKIPPNDLPQQ